MSYRQTYLVALLLATWLNSAVSSDCRNPISGSLTFEKIEQTLNTCEVKRIEDLLPLLPAEFRSRYTLVYASRSLHEATPQYPRVILFGLDAKLILAFGGNPKLHGYDLLDVIQFDDPNKKFQFRSIIFPAERNSSEKTGNSNPVLSEINPPECVACHRTELRPNWDSYAGWPGVYGSNDDTMPEVEKEKFQTFMEQTFGKVGRYRYLENAENYPDNTWYYDYYVWKRPNLQFNFLLSLLNSQANARSLKENPRLHPFRYALLASVSCDEDFNDPLNIKKLIPERISESFSKSYKSIDDEVIKSVEESYSLREKRQLELLKSLHGSAPIQEYEHEFERKEYGATASTSRVKYILEGLGISFPEWSMEFGSKHNVFFAGIAGRIGELSLFLWRELLDPVEDREIYEIYNRAWENRSVWGDVVFIGGKDRLCEALEKKSTATLNHDAPNTQ